MPFSTPNYLHQFTNNLVKKYFMKTNLELKQMYIESFSTPEDLHQFINNLVKKYISNPPNSEVHRDTELILLKIHDLFGTIDPTKISEIIFK